MIIIKPREVITNERGFMTSDVIGGLKIRLIEEGDRSGHNTYG